MGALLAAGSYGQFGSIGKRALKPMDDLVNWFDQTFDAKGENGELITKLQDVRRQAVAGQAAQAENAELRLLTHFDKSGVFPSGVLVTGRVIVRSPENPYSFLTINRGSADCIKAGNVAFNGYGLVGKVDRVSRHTARLRLVTNSMSAVSAKGESPNVRGLITPDPVEPGQLILKFLTQSKSLYAGQEILTSNWRSGSISSSFPAGIPIGQIAKVQLSRLEATESVPVKPFVDFENFELVQILTGC